MRAPVLGKSVNATTLSPRGYSAIVRLEALPAGLRGPAQLRSTNAVELLLCFLHAATQALSDSRGVLVIASEHASSHLLVPGLRQKMRHSGTVDVWTALTPDDVGFTYFDNFEGSSFGLSTPGGLSLAADIEGWTGDDVL